MEIQSRTSIEAVPLDVISEIGKHLDIKSITRFGGTAKNYRKFLICNPQNTDLYRTIYFYQYDSNKHINDDLKVNWAQLCRTHCYNRLKEPSLEDVSPSKIGELTIDYLTNKTIAAEFPLLPLFCDGTVGYYEITVTAAEDNGGYVNFGLSENGIAVNSRAVGWHADHMWIGYHGDDGRAFDSIAHSFSGVSYGPQWLYLQSKVTVGCLLDFTTAKIAFTVNGQCYNALNFGLSADLVRRLHPVIGTRENSVIEFNFGSQPFKFDLNKRNSRLLRVSQ